MSTLLYLIVALSALSVLVFFHEFGHFLAARIFGVKVERFSIGFGKILGRKRCCDTEWAFSAIPLGGYVKMKGQDDADPASKNYDPDSYNSKKPWQRIVILLAGPIANLLLAFITYFVIALAGAPMVAARDYIPPVIGDVSKDSPAFSAGIKKGDRVISVNGRNIKYWYEISEAIRSFPDPVRMEISRNGQKLDLTLSTKTVKGLNEFEEKIERRIIGVSPEVNNIKEIRFGPAEAAIYAWNETIKASLLIARGIKKIGTGEIGTEKVGGAITIFDVFMRFAEKGFIYLLFISALISVNLGILNLLPIPALDGGHIVFNIYELLTGKEPSETIYYRLTVMGWVILAGIMLLGIYNDLNRIWEG